MILCYIFILIASFVLFYLMYKEHKEQNRNIDDFHSEIKVPMPRLSRRLVTIVTDDEVRFRAYHIASDDGFKKDPHEYWIEAEKELRGSK